MKKAFILGNGPSRKPVNLEGLRDHGTIFGCNALYRDFTPDVLVAVDRRMVKEIIREDFHLNENVQIYTVPKKQYVNNKWHERFGINYIRKSGRIYQLTCSGTSALFVAINPPYGSFEKIYILGVDLWADKDDFNIYKLTENYLREESGYDEYEMNLKYWKAYIDAKPEIDFVRVVGEKHIIPEEWKNIKNLKHISVEEFKAEHSGS